eukprot:tig00000189_g14313.t1
MDLDYSGKSLSKEHLGRVLASPQCRTPLFVLVSSTLGIVHPAVLVLLEELRAGAVHGTLGQRLDEGLACTSAADLFALVSLLSERDSLLGFSHRYAEEVRSRDEAR